MANNKHFDSSFVQFFFHLSTAPKSVIMQTISILLVHLKTRHQGLFFDWVIDVFRIINTLLLYSKWVIFLNILSHLVALNMCMATVAKTGVYRSDVFFSHLKNDKILAPSSHLQHFFSILRSSTVFFSKMSEW